MTSQNKYVFENDSLRLRANIVLWDSENFGHGVAEINELSIIRNDKVSEIPKDFFLWLDKEKIDLVSCRLDCTCMLEGFLLEKYDFNFIEQVLHPNSTLSDLDLKPQPQIIIEHANEKKMHELIMIGRDSFSFERFHIDPRIDTKLANQRYAKWVKASLFHTDQQLLCISENDEVIGLFIIEEISDTHVYWHLTSIAPKHQKKRLGFKAWQAMLSYHKEQDFDFVSTTIAARNTPVLNLYSKLGFRFSSPSMTYHWFRNC